MDVDVKADGEDHFILSTNAKFSEGLISWIITMGAPCKSDFTRAD